MFPFIRNKNVRTSFYLLLIFLIGYALLLALFGMRRPCWNDECHFVDAVRLFKASPTLSTLLHYNETATPLTFILFAAWGAVAGDSLNTLRLLSMIIAVCTYCAYYFLFLKVLQRPFVALFLTVFLSLNPYMFGAGIFVYTDMLTLLFGALLCLAIKDRAPLRAFMAAAGGLLCRQYFVFAVIGAIAYCSWCFLVQKQRRDIIMAASVVGSAVPLALLFVFWKGLCPVSAARDIYLTDGLTFHPNSATVYCTQLFTYLLPVVGIYWKSLYRNRSGLVFAVLLGGTYWLFPVTASKPGIEAGRFTVGYFHRFLRHWPGQRYEQMVFFICFTLALPIVYTIVRDCCRRLRSRDTDFALFLDFSTICFFLVMPFSYMHWEKYFLPLLPLAALLIVHLASPKKQIAFVKSAGI